MHRFEHRAKKKCKIWFWKRFFQANEQCSFWENHGKYEKHARCTENMQDALSSKKTFSFGKLK